MNPFPRGHGMRRSGTFHITSRRGGVPQAKTASVFPRGGFLKACLLLLLIAVIIPAPSSARDSGVLLPPAERDHSVLETATDVSFLYAVHWGVYLAMTSTLYRPEQGWDIYRDNFFMRKIQWWDGDPFYINFIGHPYVGSQTYLYYRGRGYGRLESFLGSFAASFLFESTIEILDQPFSFNDAVLTPTLGFLLGSGFEYLSMQFINSDCLLLRIIARIINPSINFRFYEGIRLQPVIRPDRAGLVLTFAWDICPGRPGAGLP